MTEYSGRPGHPPGPAGRFGAPGSRTYGWNFVSAVLAAINNVQMGENIRRQLLANVISGRKGSESEDNHILGCFRHRPVNVTGSPVILFVRDNR